jgi:hypothetical protein
MSTSWSSTLAPAPNYPWQARRSRLRVNTRSWPRVLRLYLLIHGTWLLLYALLGKGFAYAGWPPLYVSEILLALALIAIASSGCLARLLRTPLGCLLSCFIAWQMVRTVPFFQTYEMDTLRDAAIWGYSVFAFVVAVAVIGLRGFLHIAVTDYYRKFARIYLFLGAGAWLVTLYFRDSLPTWPGTGVSIPAIKGGEYCVHMAGILAFALSGLTPKGPWIVLIIADALLGMGVRGGLLAFLISGGFILLLRPKFQRTAILLASGLIAVITMETFEIHFTIPGTSRDFSLEQLTDSVGSVLAVSQRQDLEGTKNWRLAWWSEIRDYTVYGPFFWQGKGYGINLADNDGFQVGTRDEPLRSPHNSHLTFLARSGVPGFALWISLQTFWVTLMLSSYTKASQRQMSSWSAFFSWLVAYWIAFMVSASFDVFLEGPMAGIPFWSLFGLGWGAQVIFQVHLKQQQDNLGTPVGRIRCAQ